MKINDTDNVKRQYATTSNLNTRISIHDKYSTNKMGFGNWIVSNYQIHNGAKVLELGTGTGYMWKDKSSLINKCFKLIVSDISEGMLESAKENIGFHNNIEYKTIDIQKIPYEDDTFDIVIANMMLYHVPDIDKGLKEVHRVLKKGGQFYCATYGEHGIMEYLSNLFSSYGVVNNVDKSFTLQNGYDILNKFFSEVEKLIYIDSLAVTNLDDMIDYIYSLSSMTPLSSVPRQLVKEILMKNTKHNILNVPKEYGMFISRK